MVRLCFHVVFCLKKVFSSKRSTFNVLFGSSVVSLCFHNALTEISEQSLFFHLNIRIALYSVGFIREKMFRLQH